MPVDGAEARLQLQYLQADKRIKVAGIPCTYYTQVILAVCDDYVQIIEWLLKESEKKKNKKLERFEGLLCSVS